MANPLGAPRNNPNANAGPAETRAIFGQDSAITEDARPRATLSYNDDSRPGPAHVHTTVAGLAYVEDARPDITHGDTRAGPAHVDIARLVPANVDDARAGHGHIDNGSQVLLPMLTTPDRVLTMKTPGQLIAHNVGVTSKAECFIKCLTHERQPLC